MNGRVKSNKHRKLKRLCSFKLPPDLADWLAKESDRLGKTRTRILEEALTVRRALKVAAGIVAVACNAHAAQPTSQELVAAVLVAEAAGDGVAGMRAVREVVQVRAVERRQTEWQVVTAKKQFSCLNQTTPEQLVARAKTSTAWKSALDLASKPAAVATVGLANHYHTKSVSPYWSRGKTPVAVVGGHLFFKL